MHTKDFIKQIKQLGFMHRHEDGKVFILDGFEPVLSVSENEPYKIIQYFTRFSDFTYCEKRDFMHLVWQYISTPVEERELEKRYMYKLPSDFDVKNVLTLSMLSEKYFFSRIEHEKYKGDTLMFQKYFTDKEVEMMPTDVINVLKACVKEEDD